MAIEGVRYKGVKVHSRDGKAVGYSTGALFHCRLEGCTGTRMAVSWPRKGGKSRTTYPCTKGMLQVNRAEWRIL